MTPRIALLLPALLVLLAPAPAPAGDRPGNIELTAQAGYRFGGSFEDADEREVDVEDGGAWGLVANFRADSDTQWELYYGRQSTEFTSAELFAGVPVVDVDIDYFQGGGTYIVEGDNFRPYVVMTIGASRFAPSATAGNDFDDEIFFSLSLGAGVRIAAGDRLAFRLEGRAFTSFVDSDSSLFCASGGAQNVCLIEVEGDTLTQWQVTAGLTLKF
ncbi:MAG: outer membrane beta-barrel protein [Gammaproteobacteria bacterium]